MGYAGYAYVYLLVLHHTSLLIRRRKGVVLVAKPLTSIDSGDNARFINNNGIFYNSKSIQPFLTTRSNGVGSIDFDGSSKFGCCDGALFILDFFGFNFNGH
mmetsp:Transcript_157/g.258  ORF Transcript_157/g.258 Transcript_157/m.258 type:complete len:101 (+) Transcript_157:201-503(+)